MLSTRFFLVVHAVCATIVAIALLGGSHGPGPACSRRLDGGRRGGERPGERLRPGERWTKLQHVDDGAPHVNAPPSGLSWADVLSHDKWVGMSDGELIRHLEIEGFVVLPNVLNTTTVAAVRAQALVLFRLARARECYRI